MKEHRCVLDADLGEVRDRGELFAVLARALAIPYPISGFDALLILLASVDEWMPCEGGYLVVVDGIDALRYQAEETFTKFLSILPNVSDRWRTIGTPFSLVLSGSSPTLMRARRILDDGNDRLGRAARNEWVTDTEPAVVIGPGP